MKHNEIGNFITFLNNSIRKIIDRPHYALLSLFLLSAWALIPTLGTPGLRDWDEGIYASVARNILETGDVVNLRLGDAPYFNKPPLFMILVCGSFKIFGINEFSVRIVSVLFAIGSLIVGFLLARKLFSNRTAYFSAILVLAHAHFQMTSQHGRMESLVTFFILLAFYAMFKALEKPYWINVFFIAVAFGLLTKGVLSIIPIFIFVAMCFFYKSFRLLIFNWNFALGILLLVLISTPWFLLEYQAYGASYLSEFFGRQTFERVATSLEGHRGNYFYYLDIISFRYFSVWAFLFLPALFFILLKYFRHRKQSLFFLNILLWGGFLFFSMVVQTKLPWYIYFLYFPGAVACVLLLSELPKRFLVLKKVILATSLIYILLSPATQPIKFKGYKPLRSSFDIHLSKNDVLHTLNSGSPSLFFLANCPINNMNDTTVFKTEISSKSGFFIVRKNDFCALTNNAALEVINQSDDFVFFKTNPLVR